MYYNDNFDPANENDLILDEDDFERMLEKTKKMDRGYNQLKRKYVNYEGLTKTKKIDVYTSGMFGKSDRFGSFIRDAESGSYYKNKVGSLDEDLFFKVSISTGEINTTNGINNAFYMSPQHYMKHFMCELSQDVITNWEIKRDIRLSQLNNAEVKTADYVVVK